MTLKRDTVRSRRVPDSVCVTNSSNNNLLNLGGWAIPFPCLNCLCRLKAFEYGTIRSVKLQKNTVYTIRVVVQGNNIKCYLNDSLYIDYTSEAAERLYETASVDENGDIILKFVNALEAALPVTTALNGFDTSVYETEAVVTTLSGTSRTASNSYSEPWKMIPVESTLPVAEKFETTIPGYSIVIRNKKE